MRRIFQMFEGVDVLLIHNHPGIQRQVLNLKPIPPAINENFMFGDGTSLLIRHP